MNAFTYNLVVGEQYTFVFGNGVPAVTGVVIDDEKLVIDEIGTDRRHYLNPDRVIYVREDFA